MGHNVKHCPLLVQKKPKRRSRGGSHSSLVTRHDAPKFEFTQFTRVLGHLERHQSEVAAIQASLRESFAELESEAQRVQAEAEQLRMVGSSSKGSEASLGGVEGVRFIVGGRTFLLTVAMLERFPDSLFGRLTTAQLLRANAERAQRNPEVFAIICDWLRDGVLKVDLDVGEARALHEEVGISWWWFFACFFCSCTSDSLFNSKAQRWNLESLVKALSAAIESQADHEEEEESDNDGVDGGSDHHAVVAATTREDEMNVNG